jgi:broad specificity phosphatase PhoE
MGTLHLVRHGQASFGAADYDQLSDLGARQCRELGR